MLSLEDAQVARAFNEWQRRYIDEPHSFMAEHEMILEFLTAESDGVEPSYGDQCVAYLKKIAADLNEPLNEG